MFQSCGHDQFSLGELFKSALRRSLRCGSVLFMTLFIVHGLRAQQTDSSTLSDPPPPIERYAIIVGVEPYDDPGLALKGPRNDAANIKDALVKHAGFIDDEDHIVLMTAGQSGDKRPTRPNILRQISILKTQVPSSALLVFYFSGHGFSNGDESYIVTADAQYHGDADLLASTSLSIKELERNLKLVLADQKLLIFDSCRELKNVAKAPGIDQAPLPNTAPVSFEELNRGIRASAILFATDLGHYAYSDPKTNDGIFTRSLVKALSGAAADDVGRVTLRNIIAYTKNEVPGVAKDLQGKDAIQIPRGEVNGSYGQRDLVLALTPPPYVSLIVDWLKALDAFNKESEKKRIRIAANVNLKVDDAKYESASDVATKAREKLDKLNIEQRRAAFEYFFLLPDGRRLLESDGQPSSNLSYLALLLYDEKDPISATKLGARAETLIAAGDLDQVSEYDYVEMLRRSEDYSLLIRIAQLADKKQIPVLFWSAIGSAAQTSDSEIAHAVVGGYESSSRFNSSALIKDRPEWAMTSLASLLAKFNLTLSSKGAQEVEKAFVRIQEELKYKYGNSDKSEAFLKSIVLDDGFIETQTLFRDLFRIVALSTSMQRAAALVDTTSETTIWNLPNLLDRQDEDELSPEALAHLLLDSGAADSASKLHETLRTVSAASRIQARGTDFNAHNREETAIVALVRTYKDRDVQERLIDLARVLNPAYAGWACKNLELIAGVNFKEPFKDWFWEQEGETLAVWHLRVKVRVEDAVKAYEAAVKNRTLVFDEKIGWFD